MSSPFRCVSVRFRFAVCLDSSCPASAACRSSCGGPAGAETSLVPFKAAPLATTISNLNRHAPCTPVVTKSGVAAPLPLPLAPLPSPNPDNPPSPKPNLFPLSSRLSPPPPPPLLVTPAFPLAPGGEAEGICHRIVTRSANKTQRTSRRHTRRVARSIECAERSARDGDTVS